MTPKETYAAILKSLEKDIEQATIDQMIYGRSFVEVTKDGLRVLPLDEWPDQDGVANLKARKT